MEWLYTIAFLTGVCTVFFDIAYQSYLPTLVSKEQLVGTNSMLEGSRSAAQMTGPGLAGALIQLITAPMAMLVTSLSFFLSALSLRFIKKEEATPVRPDTPRSLWQDIREGLHLSFSEPLLFGVIRCSAIFNFSWNVMFSVYVLYAITTLHISSGWLGLVYGGLGPVIVGSAIIASCGGPFAPLAMGTGSSAVFLLMLGQFFFGFGMSMWSISTLSLRQAIVPDQLQGRVNATVRFVAWGAYPLGSLAGGVIGDMYGMQIALFTGAAGLMIAVLTLFFTPFLKSKEKTIDELHRG